MRVIIRYTFIIGLAMMFGEAAGQNNQLLYYMNLPQNHLMNPAMRPSNSVYIGLPVISGTTYNINNNFLNYSDLFVKSPTSDSLISILNPEYDIDDFIDKINERNSISPQFSLQTFGLGFSAGKGLYFFFDINERVEANAVFPGDIIKLILKGNEAFVGSEISLSSFRMDFRYFREYGFGFSKDFGNNLRIGVRPKIFSGILSTTLDNRSLGIQIDENYNHTLNADVTANISAPITVYEDSEHNIDRIEFDESQFDSGRGMFDYITGTKNYGFGLDLGATYKITDNLIVSAAVTDIGYIKWKRDVTNITAKGEFVFSGMDLTEVINGDKTFDEAADEILDSLKNAITVTTTNSPFNTWLAPAITLGGSYNVTKNISFGLLSYTRFVGSQVRESLTLSANLNLGNAFSLSLGYTLQNQRADNLGAGFAFRAGVFQFYAITDRIPITWSNINSDGSNGVVLPSNWNTVNLRLGMNLTFGNKMKKKDDKPMMTTDPILEQ